jgi:hypothetical protein
MGGCTAVATELQCLITTGVCFISISYAEEAVGDLGVHWMLLQLPVNILHLPSKLRMLYLKILMHKICKYYYSEYNSTHYVEAIVI